MISLLLLAAAPEATTVPRLGKPIGNIALWFSRNDWSAKRKGGAVRFKTVFAKDGTFERCSIEATTGNAAVNELACRRAQERFRFEPSIDSDGQPAHRVLVRYVNFEHEEMDDIRPLPAYMVDLPIKGKPQLLDVTVDVDAAGALRGCASPANDKRLASFGSAICEALAASWRPVIETDAADQPLRYVRDLNILIRPAPAS